MSHPIALTSSRIFERIKAELGFDKFRDENIRIVLDLAGEFFASGQKELNQGKLLSRLGGNESAKSAILQATAKADITKDTEKALEDCMFCVRKENREEELKVLTGRLKKAQASDDDKEIKEILLKINRIHKEKVI